MLGGDVASPLAPCVPLYFPKTVLTVTVNRKTMGGVCWLTQEEDQEDAGAVAPGLAPTMSAAKAAKSAAEKDARIAVSKARGLSFRRRRQRWLYR